VVVQRRVEVRLVAYVAELSPVRVASASLEKPASRAVEPLVRRLGRARTDFDRPTAMTHGSEAGLLRPARRANLSTKSSISMKSKSTELPQEQQPIKFKVNIIAPAGDAPGGARFVRAFIVGDDAEPEPELENRANFELGTVYMMTEDNRRGRVLSRQIDRMEEENALRDWAEERLSEELPREVADALQAANDESVGRQMAFFSTSLI
jgi:hypothetical protein